MDAYECLSVLEMTSRMAQEAVQRWVQPGSVVCMLTLITSHVVIRMGANHLYGAALLSH